MIEQTILRASENYAELDAYFNGIGVKKLLLVCDSSIEFLKINSYFESLQKRQGIKCIHFSNFQPNPRYESVVEGVEIFHKSGADMIVAVGGGSAMDVAKCIKLYSNMSDDECYLKQAIILNDVPLLAVPTTAGTGSEATRYAVIYYEGTKQSITDYSIIPSVVLMDASVLKTLPMYQRKATMLDALCHAIESYWSVNSNEESMQYSKAAIETIIANKNAYFANDDEANANMLIAANLAGKAINITQTTAGHAMCYKITSLYNFAHGHAAALCVSKLWPWMIANIDKCIDYRGSGHLNAIFDYLSIAFGVINKLEAAQTFQTIIDEMEFPKCAPKAEDFSLLASSVNPMRLKNHPIALDVESINSLYHEILK